MPRARASVGGASPGHSVHDADQADAPGAERENPSASHYAAIGGSEAPSCAVQTAHSPGALSQLGSSRPPLGGVRQMGSTQQGAWRACCSSFEHAQPIAPLRRGGGGQPAGGGTQPVGPSPQYARGPGPRDARGVSSGILAGAGLRPSHLRFPSRNSASPLSPHHSPAGDDFRPCAEACTRDWTGGLTGRRRDIQTDMANSLYIQSKACKGGNQQHRQPVRQASRLTQ